MSGKRFFVGAAIAAHQAEGNNIHSDCCGIWFETYKIKRRLFICNIFFIIHLLCKCGQG